MNDYIDFVLQLYRNDIIIRSMPKSGDQTSKRSSDNTSSKLSRRRSQEQLGSAKLVDDQTKPSNIMTINDSDSD